MNWRPFIILIAVLGKAPLVMADEQPFCLKTHIVKPDKITSPTMVSDADDLALLQLELAQTPAQREKGLMNRKDLAPCDGMAFLFPKTGIQKFWMKNTLIPLDILFVDDTGKIVAITTGKPLSEEPIGPDVPVATVIEIAVGQAEKLGITTGDRVFYELQVNPKMLAQ